MPPLVGNPSQVADSLVQLHRGDGFQFSPIYYDPQFFEGIVALLSAELRNRGVFHSDYDGNSLRENLGG